MATPGHTGAATVGALCSCRVCILQRKITAAVFATDLGPEFRSKAADHLQTAYLLVLEAAHLQRVETEAAQGGRAAGGVSPPGPTGGERSAGPTRPPGPSGGEEPKGAHEERRSRPLSIARREASEWRRGCSAQSAFRRKQRRSGLLKKYI